MKLIFTLLGLLFLSVSLSQTELAGVWIIKGESENAPKVIEFKSDGEFIIFENDSQRPENTKAVTEGNYYYEDGKDLLVTVTWYGSQAKTTKYTYEIKNGQLVLTQIYPDKASWTFEREVALSEKL